MNNIISMNSLQSSTTYHVGDYYNANGKEGVVFWVDDSGEHGKIVSLDQEYLEWSTIDQYERNVIVDTLDHADGQVNTNKVLQRPDKSEYPAFLWCVELGEGWYLPAIDELNLLLLDAEVRNAVNLALEGLGVAMLLNVGELGEYWSSTEYRTFQQAYGAWCVYMEEGLSSNSLKFSRRYVRAVATF